MEPTKLSIKDIQDKYRIKQSTAYKWRKWLIDTGKEVNWENLEKINKRVYNLSETSLLPVKTTPVEISEPEPEPLRQNGDLFGLSIARLRELNAEAELEVQVKDKLRELHEDQLRQSKAVSLKAKAEEVKQMDLGKFRSLLGVIA